MSVAPEKEDPSLPHPRTGKPAGCHIPGLPGKPPKCCRIPPQQQMGTYHHPTAPQCSPAWDGGTPQCPSAQARVPAARGPHGCPQLTRDGERGEAGSEGLPHGLELLLQGKGLPLLLRQLLLQLLLGAVHALRVLLQDGVLLLKLRVHLAQAPQLGLPGCRDSTVSTRTDPDPPLPNPNPIPATALPRSSVSPTPRLQPGPAPSIQAPQTPSTAPTFVLVQELLSEDGHIEGGEGVTALASLRDKREGLGRAEPTRGDPNTLGPG